MKYSNNKLTRYSIRKYSIGVASVLIGFFFMGVSASADQVTEKRMLSLHQVLLQKNQMLQWLLQIQKLENLQK